MNPQLLDFMIRDRIEALVYQGLYMEPIDGELSDYILLVAKNFAQTIDNMQNDDAIFWCNTMALLTPDDNNNKQTPRIDTPETLARNYTTDQLLDERNTLKKQGKSLEVIDQALRIKCG